MVATYGAWEPVIGLEVHAQLLTRSKLFCGCATSFGDAPNLHTCPVCLGLPGALPVLNEAALRLAVSASLALDCRVNPRSIFARKNYFYPDLPKGYQISQYEQPLAEHGHLDVDTEGGPFRAGITRVHMEEDAGKNLHARGGRSVVDLNRAGTPLIEIVGEPDLRTPAQARAYLRALREVLMFAGVNDGNLEQGSFRCDANVSVRRRGETRFGTRVEIKNVNSFRFVEDALDVEIRRQIELCERGAALKQETRGYNPDRRQTFLMREKEGDAGYRYFPEPDLPPLCVGDDLLAGARAALPELPAARRARYVADLGLSDYAAGLMVSHPAIAALFEEAVAAGGEPGRAASFVGAEVLRDVHTDGLNAQLPIGGAQLARLLALVADGTISGKQAKVVYAEVAGTGRDPEQVVSELGLRVERDEGALDALAARLIAEHPKQAAQYRSGKTALLGFFVGQLMKATSGSADPKLANEVLRRCLDAAPATGDEG